MQTQSRPRGVKSYLLGLEPQDSIIFPRVKYSVIRSTLSTLRVERPEREFSLNIIENGLEMTRVK